MTESGSDTGSILGESWASEMEKTADETCLDRPMNTYLLDGALGRFLAFFKVFVQATFAYGGSEMCVIAAGETVDPRRNIPKAVRRVFWRILMFYVL